MTYQIPANIREGSRRFANVLLDCAAILDIEPPVIEYEDNEVLLTQDLLDWCGKNELYTPFNAVADPAVTASRVLMERKLGRALKRMTRAEASHFLELTNWMLDFRELGAEEMVAGFQPEMSILRNTESWGSIDYTAARKRIRERAKELEATPPFFLLADDGGPHDDLLSFCQDTNTSLDWIFRDDYDGGNVAAE